MPTILHVDDFPDDLTAWADELSASGLKIQLRHPNEVTVEDLSAAALVLVDYKIEVWPERSVIKPVALRPMTGLAVLAVLQAASGVLEKPRAFTLYTAAPRELANGLVPQPHIIARAHNLEWVFDKGLPSTRRREQVATLTKGVDALPSTWPTEGPAAAAALKNWLGLSESAEWIDSAWRSIVQCRPPIHDLARSTRGVGVMRWMLHRILPYPTFLIDDIHLASRLRMDVREFRAALNVEAFRKTLTPALFTGGLSGFAGQRWWRSGVEAIIYSLTSDDPSSIELLHARLSALAPDIEVLEDASMRFPALDANYEFEPALAKAADVVEITPDDWPPYADLAWARRTELEDFPDLKAISNLVESD